MRRLAPVLLTLAMAVPAQAATITQGGDTSLNCRVTVSGEIAPGDAARMIAALDAVLAGYDMQPDLPPEQYFNKGEIRVCLDSAGGDWAEALRMGDALAYRYPDLAYPYTMIGTAIASGATCEGPCAMVFMAGGYFSHLSATGFHEPDRLLHTNATLGFGLPDGIDPLEAINAIADRAERYMIYPNLFREILGTPPGSLTRVETVAHAASWRIQLSGTPAVRDPGPVAYEYACKNLTAGPFFALGARYRYSDAAPAEIRDQAGGLFHLYSYGIPNAGYWGDAMERRAEDGWFVQGDTQVSFVLPGCFGMYFPDTRKIILNDGDALSMHYEVFTPARIGGRMPLRQTYWAEGDTLRPGEAGNWMLFPPWTRLGDMSRAARDSGDGWIPGDTVLTPVTDRFTAHCAGLEGGAVVADTDCAVELIGRVTADARTVTQTVVIRWPGGSETRFPLGAPEQAEPGPGGADLRHAGRWPDMFDGALNVPPRYDESLGLSACFTRPGTPLAQCVETTGFTGTDFPFWDR